MVLERLHLSVRALPGPRSINIPTHPRGRGRGRGRGGSISAAKHVYQPVTARAGKQSHTATGRFNRGPRRDLLRGLRAWIRVSAGKEKGFKVWKVSRKEFMQ